MFDAPAPGNRLEFLDETYHAKTRGMGLTYGDNFIILASTVFEILAALRPKIANFAYRDLETRVRGHSRSLILVTMESACTFLLVINDNFSPILHRFGDMAA